MQWKKFDIYSMKELIDDNDYLVSWKSSDGRYYSSTKAYWNEEEMSFFPFHPDFTFPLRVDIFCEIPKLP